MNKLSQLKVTITSIKGLPHNVEGGLTPESINQITSLIEKEIIGEDTPYLEANSLASHWGLTEDGLDRTLNNGKNLGKNDLRAEQRAKLKELIK